MLRGAPPRFIVFCDDLSFDADDTSYKSLKAVLEGGIEGRPDNVIFYATSNRRHLMPREMMENERSTAINPGEAVEEKVSLSDRFGLWLGFHRCSQDEYLAMVEGYVAPLPASRSTPRRCAREALEWATTRGARSGRVAWQFVQDSPGGSAFPWRSRPPCADQRLEVARCDRAVSAEQYCVGSTGVDALADLEMQLRRGRRCRSGRTCAMIWPRFT